MLDEVDRARADGVGVELVEAGVGEVVVGEAAGRSGSRRGAPVALAVVVEDGDVGPTGPALTGALTLTSTGSGVIERVLGDDPQRHAVALELDPLAQRGDLPFLRLHRVYVATAPSRPRLRVDVSVRG